MREEKLKIEKFMTAQYLKPIVEPAKKNKQLHCVSLAANQLDKFENVKFYAKSGFQVFTVFCSDPYLDF